MLRVQPRPAFIAWVALSLIGATLIALPDDDARVFSLTEAHGPALLDLVGAILAGVGFVAYVVGLVAARPPARLLWAPAAVYVAGSALAGWSVATDTGRWWLVGIAVALAGQGWAAWRATRGR